jgi:hypothetical protein
MDAANLFVTGIVVSDLDRAMTEVGEALGTRWTPAQQADLTLDIGGGRETVALRFCYSLTGPPHIELIEAIPETYYDARGGPYTHHVGAWVDDLVLESKRLEALGMPLEAAGVGPEGQTPFMFVFHTSPHGFRIELVDRMMQPTFQGWIGGGELGL